jgi:hypothetical protein
VDQKKSSYKNKLVSSYKFVLVPVAYELFDFFKVYGFCAFRTLRRGWAAGLLTG